MPKPKRLQDGGAKKGRRSYAWRPIWHLRLGLIQHCKSRLSTSSHTVLHEVKRSGALAAATTQTERKDCKDGSAQTEAHLTLQELTGHCKCFVTHRLRNPLEIVTGGGCCAAAAEVGQFAEQVVERLQVQPLQVKLWRLPPLSRLCLR